ncbi:MAG: hypothetical protein GAK43_02486 [Stenotrophomonas maltophilia]|nr:MAG: hypothetical protein GAK43_02486 [Stenotrophomonas maltophilia]
MLARIDEQHFALLAMVDSLQDCSPASFKRLHEGLNLKAFKTREGFLSLKAGIGLLGMDAQSLPLEVERALEQARALLPDAYASGRIHANRVGPVR